MACEKCEQEPCRCDECKCENCGKFCKDCTCEDSKCVCEPKETFQQVPLQLEEKEE